MISAKVILDSINPYNGVRLTTLELKYPRFIHAEFMTHRVMSRNSASSRAIPIDRMISMVVEDTAMPVFWAKNKRGMSPTKEIEDTSGAEKLWLEARDSMVDYARKLSDLGLHKQIVNRILEPWKNITVICTATEWSNFFSLRLHPDAQQEIQCLAQRMEEAFTGSRPIPRYWHIPYIQDDELHLDTETKVKIGVARCARVSFLTHDGVRSIDKDIELYQRLLTGSGKGHWSPQEHVAKATNRTASYFDFATNTWNTSPIWCGNFRGWIQHRKTFKGESQ